MTYKGRIISVEKNYAIVITNKMEYYKIEKKDCLGIGKEIIFINDDIYNNSDIKCSTIVRYAASFLIIVFTVSLLLQMNTGFNKASTAAALVSIDINPSIELSVDSENRVIDINPINNEGMEIVEDDLVGTDIFESILVLVKTARNQNYIKSDSGFMIVSLALISGDSSLNIDKIKEEIDKGIANDLKLRNLNIVYLKANTNDIENARKERISIGKYEISRKLSKGEQGIELGAFKSMGIKELIEMELRQTQNRYKNQEQNNERTTFIDKDYESEYQSFMKSMKQRKEQISTNSEQSHQNRMIRAIKENEQQGLLQEEISISDVESQIEIPLLDNSNLEVQQGAAGNEVNGQYGMEGTPDNNSKKDYEHGRKDRGRNNKR